MTDRDKRRKQMAKNKKIAEVQSAGVQAQISLLLEGVANSSVEILSCTKRATVVLLRIDKNTGVFKLGTDSSRWLPKIQKVIEVFADFTKSGEDIFCVINEQKLPLAEIPEKKAEKMTLKTDSAGRLNLFALGVLRKMEYEGLKNLSLIVTRFRLWCFPPASRNSTIVRLRGATRLRRWSSRERWHNGKKLGARKIYWKMILFRA